MTNDIFYLPNGALVVMDDAVCKEFLLKAGHFADLEPKPPFDQITTVFETPGAYVWGKHDYDHPLPEDNGYTLLILPKDKFNPLTAAIEIAKAEQECALFPDMAATPIPGPQPVNN